MEKREQIVRLAVAFIKEESFTHLTFEHIAQQLAITKTAVHYYFRTKNDLGLAVCDQLITGLNQQYEEYQAQPLQRPLDFFKARAAFIDQQEICPITSLQSDIYEFSAELQKKIQELTETEYAVFRQVIAAKSGEEKADYYTQNYLSIVKGSFIYQRVAAADFRENALRFIEENLTTAGIEGNR